AAASTPSATAAPRSHHPAWPGPGPPVPGVTLTTRIPSRSAAAAKSALVTPNGSQCLVRSLAVAAIARPFVRDRRCGREHELYPDLFEAGQGFVQCVVDHRRHAARAHAGGQPQPPRHLRGNPGRDLHRQFHSGPFRLLAPPRRHGTLPASRLYTI